MIDSPTERAGVVALVAPFIPVPPPRAAPGHFVGAGVGAAVFGMSCGYHLTT